MSCIIVIQHFCMQEQVLLPSVASSNKFFEICYVCSAVVVHLSVGGELSSALGTTVAHGGSVGAPRCCWRWRCRLCAQTRCATCCKVRQPPTHAVSHASLSPASVDLDRPGTGWKTNECYTEAECLAMASRSQRFVNKQEAS